MEKVMLLSGIEDGLSDFEDCLDSFKVCCIKLDNAESII